jgi:hypothetical protein
MKTWDESVDEIMEQDRILCSLESEPCKKHRPFKGGYLEHQEYMEQKIKHGARQKRCNKCGYWLFKSEF